MSVPFIQSRLMWVTKPLGFLFLVLWVLHPVTGKSDLLHQALVGFLMGTVYGVVVYRQSLLKNLTLSLEKGHGTPNKVPETYYWGHITQVMFDNN